MEDTYSDDLVAELINEKFIPIKVDTDKRPDINERYNQGGWPTTAFLTPDGMIITGATYMPPGQLAIMLEQVSNYFHRNKDEPHFDIQKPETLKTDVKPIMDSLAEEMLASFDTSYGGFGSQPKFPLPDLIEAALLRFRQTNDKSMLKIATKTLDGMMGIFDNAEGGFFRYSVTREWNLPHYEKMLETNAQMIVNYIHAFRITGEEKYKATAGRTADFLMSVLHGPEGFYGSQDADKEEGYYGKPLEERRKVSQPFIDRNVYVNLNALAISALLHLENYEKIAIDTLENLWAKCFDPKRGICHYDDGKQNVFGLLSDNVNFVKCLLDAYEKTANGKYLEQAKQLADIVIERFYENGFKDKASGEDDIGLLKTENKNINENSIAAGCLVRLAFCTNDDKYREIAKDTLSIFANCMQYRLHAASYALAVERFLDPIEISAKGKEFIKDMPTDFRIMVRFSDDLPENIMICLSGTCMKFNSFDEAKKSLVVMR